jgi:hypothetical protein
MSDEWKATSEPIPEPETDQAPPGTDWPDPNRVTDADDGTKEPQW